MKIIAVKKMDRGLAYGESCFETFRVIDGVVFDWQGHWLRLLTGLDEFGVSFAAEQGEEVRLACLEAAKKSGSDSLVRLTVSAGEADWGLMKKAPEPIIYIQCMPYLYDDSPLVLRLKSWPFPLKKKIAKCSADYAETSRLLRGDADAHVLFEKNGMLLAAATANILVFRDGAWFTPPADVGILAGRVRDLFIRKGLVNEMPCPVEWLERCEAAVICNSGVFVRPVAAITHVQRSQSMRVEHHAIRLLIDVLKQKEGVNI